MPQSSCQCELNVHCPVPHRQRCFLPGSPHAAGFLSQRRKAEPQHHWANTMLHCSNYVKLQYEISSWFTAGQSFSFQMDEYIKRWMNSWMYLAYSQVNKMNQSADGFHLPADFVAPPRPVSVQSLDGSAGLGVFCSTSRSSLCSLPFKRLIQLSALNLLRIFSCESTHRWPT